MPPNHETRENEPQWELMLAKSIVDYGLNLNPQDRFVVICDQEDETIAREIQKQAKSRAASSELIPITRFGRHPFDQAPESLWNYLAQVNPTASCMLMQWHPGEPSLTTDITSIVQRYQCRHIHVPGIPLEALRESASVDMTTVLEQGLRLKEAIVQTKQFTVRSGKNQEFELKITPSNPKYWVIETGQVRDPGVWLNYPDGELEMFPLSINGEFAVCEIGGPVGRKYGMFPNPAILRIKEGRLMEIVSDQPEFIIDLKQQLDTDPSGNGWLIGEFAMGCNSGIKRRGVFVLDEKSPGVHIAMGNVRFPETIAGPRCRTHVDALGVGEEVIADGRIILTKGNLILP